MRHLGIVGKYWQAGAVKTRLARSLGPDAAAELYRVFLTTLLRRFDSVGDRRWLVFTPTSSEPAFREIAEHQWELVPQASGDLGNRMQLFFDHAAAAGAGKTILIGSDSPTLPSALLEEAFRKLEQHATVLGPSTDGGFYLIGSAGPLPADLQGLAWSTPDVLHDTTQRFEGAGASCYHLPAWYDIDELEHLRKLDQELQTSSRRVHVLAPLARAVREALRASE